MLRLLTFLLVAIPSLTWAADPRPNIVFIMADDLGYTDVGCFGSRYYETPNIDRLSTQGMSSRVIIIVRIASRLALH